MTRAGRFALFSISAFTLSGLVGAAGIRVNTTASFPVGIYRQTGERAGKGSLVLFCPPKAGVFDEALARGYIGAGSCPGGYGYMIKRILAAKNDRVSIAPEGVFINGAMVPNSAQVPTDTAGHPLPAYRAELALDQGQVLLLSDYNGRSFDARYFGPVDAGQIRGVLAPILTW